MVFVTSTGHYLATVFGLSYLTEQLAMPKGMVMTGLMLGSTISAISMLLFAHVAYCLGRQAVATWSAASLLFLSFPYFWLINSRQPALIWLAFCSWGLAAGALYGVTGVLLAELFEPRVRYSGISFGYQMAGVLCGAPVQHRHTSSSLDTWCLVVCRHLFGCRRSGNASRCLLSVE